VQKQEIVEPLREKIRDLEKSFTQKYPPVKFLSEKDRKRILGDPPVNCQLKRSVLLVL